MSKRFNNGLGIAILAAIMAVTPLVPVAVSAPVPDWRWDENGRVYDAYGNYVRVETESKQPPPLLYPEFLSSTGGDYGSVAYNGQRKHWFMSLRWQGERHYFSQIPTRGEDWLPCSTKEMAEHLQREISREIDRGTFHPARWQRSKPLRLKHWVLSWIERQTHIRHATLSGYKHSLSNHIIPALVDKFIGDISHADYGDLYSRLQLAPKYKKNVFVCLFKIIEDARRAGVIAQVPERLRFDGPRSIPQHEIQSAFAGTQAGGG